MNSVKNAVNHYVTANLVNTVSVGPTKHTEPLKADRKEMNTVDKAAPKDIEESCKVHLVSAEETENVVKIVGIIVADEVAKVERECTTVSDVPNDGLEVAKKTADYVKSEGKIVDETLPHADITKEVNLKDVEILNHAD